MYDASQSLDELKEELKLKNPSHFLPYFLRVQSEERSRYFLAGG